MIAALVIMAMTLALVFRTRMRLLPLALALAAAGGHAKTAIVALLAGVDAPTARSRLDASERSIARALEEPR